MSEFALVADHEAARRRALALAGLVLFGVYVAFATTVSLFLPLTFPVFIAPAALAFIAFAPQGYAAPRRIILPLVVAAAGLMPLWPAYIHLALGPLPILTPPRVLFYVLTVIWVYDMATSPWRRGVFQSVVRRRPWLSGSVFVFFALGALSLPMAEGRIAATQNFVREAVIYLIPFCIMASYVRRWRDLRMILMAIVFGATLAGAIAVWETASQTLLVTKLSPLIMSDGAWIDIAQSVKSRDGTFRAQATHTHPISLGEYLTFGACIAGGFFMQARKRWKLFWLGAIAVMACGAVATNSRGAMMAMAVGGAFFAAAFAWKILRDPRRRRFRPLVGLAAMFVLAASPVAVIGAHYVITGEAGASAARSSQSRIDQIEQAWPKIVKRPILGYGVGRAPRVVGYFGRVLTLDNYYLSLTVDLGVPGPIVFVTILFAAVIVARSWARRGPPGAAWVLTGLMAALAAFFVSRMILSQTGNLNFVFPLLGALAGASAQAARRRIRS